MRDTQGEGGERVRKRERGKELKVLMFGGLVKDCLGLGLGLGLGQK